MKAKQWLKVPKVCFRKREAETDLSDKMRDENADGSPEKAINMKGGR